MFRGPEQQMISSSKAKDKASKSFGFSAEKSRGKEERDFVSRSSSRGAGLASESERYLVQFSPRFPLASLDCLALLTTARDESPRWKMLTQLDTS